MYIKRRIESTVLKLTRSFPVVLLTGPRQVGKTTLFEQLRKESGHSYVSLDEFEIRTLAKRDPGMFLEQYQPPLIIDEIQYAPQLLPYLKSRVDRSRKKSSFWLTGSQHFHLMKGVSESLAGRVAVLKLLGVSAAEEKGGKGGLGARVFEVAPAKLDCSKINLKELFGRILRGGFPRLLTRGHPPIENFYGSYVQTYIDRDLRDLVRVGSLSSFETFIRLCAARTAQLLNLSDLARDSGISVNTAKEWLALLEASGHIYLLRPYYQNINKRLIKSPKLYFLDTGLVCYLTGWKTAETAMKGAMAGGLFETFVLAELIKSFWNQGLEAPIWFFRTKEKEEVDILIDRNGKLYPIEIKLSARISNEDLRGIKCIKKTNIPIGRSFFITASPHAYPLAGDIFALPYTIVENL